MNPQNPNESDPNKNSTPFSSGFSSSGVDVPPDPSAVSSAPVNSPAPTNAQPLSEVNTPVPGTLPTNPTPAPTAPMGMAGTDMISSSVTKKSGVSIPRRPVIAALVMLFMILGAFSFIKFLLPRLQSGGTVNSSIVWWGLWENPEVVQPLIDEYQATHPGVTVKYELKAKEQYRERLSNAIAQGQGPDIMTIHNSWVPMFRNSLSAMPSSVFSPQEYQQTFYPIITADMTSGSSIVGIPTGYDGLGLFVNDEIFSTYGKPTPQTWNDVRDTAIALTIRDDKGIIKQSGIAMGSTKNVDHWQEILALLMIQNGAKLENPTGSLAEGALDFFTIFSTKDKVWDTTLPSSTTMFANGGLAMMLAPSWRAHDILAINPTLKFRVLPVPQLPKNAPNEPDLAYATYWASSVSNKSKNEAAAWDFLKFLSTKESYQKLYDNASKVRAFGQPFPRIDMRDSLAQDPKVSGFISLAGNAKSWFLNARTFDGETGINSRIGKYFEDAVNASSADNSGSSKSALTTAANGVLQVLVDYGLAQAPAATPK